MADQAGRVVESSIVTAEVRAALERLRELAAELVATLFDAEADEATVERAGQLLLEIGPSAVEPLVRGLRDDPHRGREVAAGLLCEMGEPAVRALVASFTDEDPDVRATSAFLFTALRDHCGIAALPLIGLLDDPEELVRQTAAYALGAQDCRRAVPRLIALATRPVQLPVPARDGHDDTPPEDYPYDQCAAVDALGQLGDPRAVRPLLFLVESQGSEGAIYEEAVHALGLLGDARGAQAVRQAFESTRTDGDFADVLAGMFGHGVLEDLLDLAESEDPIARRSVCEDLVRIASPRAAATVAALLLDPDDEVRTGTREALAASGDEEAVAEIIAGLDSPSPEAREYAVALLPVLLAWSD